MTVVTLDPITRRVQVVLIQNAAEAHGAPVYRGPVCRTCGFQDVDVDPDCAGRCEQPGGTA